MSAAKIREVLERYGETYDTRKGGTVWEVQGTPVISHKCLERVAAKAGIIWDAPIIVRAERDEAVILVTGTLGKRREWSLGEALVNVNYRVSGKQAGYVYAMAEKRSKDRVILKLVELHGLAYSEDEADDFKQPQSAPAAPPADLRNVHDLHTNGKPIVRNASQEISALSACCTTRRKRNSQRLPCLRRRFPRACPGLRRRSSFTARPGRKTAKPCLMM